MQKASLFSICTLSLFLTAGCASDPSMGELMLEQSEGTEELGEQWLEGKALVTKGEKLKEKGKKRKERGEKLIDDGEDMIDDGKEMIDDGEDMIDKGKGIMEKSEKTYKKSFPGNSLY